MAASPATSHKAHKQNFSASEISVLLMPTVSPITCTKLPLAKNLRAMRTWSIGFNAWFRAVLLCRSLPRKFVINKSDCLPNLYRACNSASVYPSIPGLGGRRTLCGFFAVVQH